MIAHGKCSWCWRHLCHICSSSAAHLQLTNFLLSEPGLNTLALAHARFLVLFFSLWVVLRDPRRSSPRMYIYLCLYVLICFVYAPSEQQFLRRTPKFASFKTLRTPVLTIPPTAELPYFGTTRDPPRPQATAAIHVRKGVLIAVIFTEIARNSGQRAPWYCRTKRHRSQRRYTFAGVCVIYRYVVFGVTAITDACATNGPRSCFWMSR